MRFRRRAAGGSAVARESRKKKAGRWRERKFGRFAQARAVKRRGQKNARVTFDRPLRRPWLGLSRSRIFAAGPAPVLTRRNRPQCLAIFRFRGRQIAVDRGLERRNGEPQQAENSGCGIVDEMGPRRVGCRRNLARCRPGQERGTSPAPASVSRDRRPHQNPEGVGSA